MEPITVSPVLWTFVTAASNWPEVRKALDEVGYNGWMTIEGGNLSNEENSKRLDLIIGREIGLPRAFVQPLFARCKITGNGT